MQNDHSRNTSNISLNIIRNIITGGLSSGSILFLFCVCIRFLFFPVAKDVTMIYDFTVLIVFEFFLNPINLLLLICAHTFWGRIGVLLFFAGFIYTFYTFMIDGAQMKYILFFVALNHFIPFVRRSEDEVNTGTLVYIGRTMLFFLLMFFVCIFQFILPEGGLNSDFLTAADYKNVQKHTGLLLDYPHITLNLGLLYYGGILLGQILTLRLKFKSHQLRVRKQAPQIARRFNRRK